MGCEKAPAEIFSLHDWMKENVRERERGRVEGAIGAMLSGAPKGTYWNKECAPGASQPWLKVPPHITHKVYIFLSRVCLQEDSDSSLQSFKECNFRVKEIMTHMGFSLLVKTEGLVCLAAWWRVNAARRSMTESACLITPRHVPEGRLSAKSGFS